MKTCRVEGCDQKVSARGLCGKHHYRLAVSGSTDAYERCHRPFEERLWSKIDKRGPDECWPWTAGTYRQGYGSVYRDGLMRKAHREVWVLVNGPIPEGEGAHGTVIRHKCDNPLCCNPAHLEIGSHADNMADMKSRGRGRGKKQDGEAHHGAVLTDEIVMQIRSGVEPDRVWAERLGVSRPTITMARSGATWRHLPIPESAVDRRHGAVNRKMRLTESAVREIRASSDTMADLGRRYGVSPKTIQALLSGRTWKHVT